jgi:sensor c-di-GMP phosphodiesterase-like protein
LGNAILRQTFKPILYALLMAAAVLAPVLGLLWLSYTQTVDKVRTDLALVSRATIERSNQILSIVQKELADLAAQGITSCSDADRAVYEKIVYRVIQIRNIGVLDRDKRLFHCTHDKVYDPPIPMTKLNELDIGPPGAIAIIPPAEDLAHQRSIFINYGLPGGRIIDAAIYPEQFWDFQSFLHMGDDGGVFLLDQNGGLISGFGSFPVQTVADIKLSGNTLQNADHQFFAARASSQFPIIAVTTASEEFLLRQWKHNARIFLPLGLLLSVIGGFFSYRLAMRPSELREDLRKAISRGHITVRYQPIFNMVTGKVVGAEVLARWQHHARGAISPDEFIPLAERHGMLPQLSAHVFRLAINELASTLVENPELKLSINVGRDDLRLDGPLDLAMRERSSWLKHLQLELTEREFLPAETDGTIEVLMQWRALGIRIALDDFGTGYANLTYLHHFPLDALKVDRSFIAGVDTPHGEKLFETITQIARSLNFQLIVEGVERQSQADYLRRNGIVEAQGWLFARDESAAEYIARVSAAN